MMIARWSIDAKFGYKPEAINLMTRWANEIAPQIGWTKEKLRMYTGSIGALESTIQSEILIQDLSDLSQAWEKLATIEAHKKWGKELEAFVVSGTNRWEIFRVLD
jgi:hypothetical protein